MVFDKIDIKRDQYGHIVNWSADIKYFRDGIHITNDVILPNDPSFHDGLGIYIKTVQMRTFPAALIEVSREPGAFWALLGGIFFLAGMTILLIIKIKKEE